MERALLDADGRLLNHTELVYAPGERRLTAQVFETIGCRVVDPGGPYLVILVDPRSQSFYDNVLYASEMTGEQLELERSMRGQLAGSSELADTYRKYRARFEREPQRTTHFGIRLGSPAELEDVEKTLDSSAGELAGRLRLARVFRPGDPGSLDPQLVQAFLWTDVCAAGLTCLGQHIELQVRLSSRAPRAPEAKPTGEARRPRRPGAPS